MGSNYPGGLDILSAFRNDNTVMLTNHASDHNDIADAINKIEAELGINPSGALATVRARLDAIQPTSPSPYTVTNTSTDRTINGSSTTIAELLNVVGTLIFDLKDRGVIG